MSVKDYFLARFKRTGEWFRSLSVVNKIILCVAAIGFIGTVVVVPIFATRDTEPGFMHACFVDGHAVYIEEGGDCSGREVNEVILNKALVPFTVTVDEERFLSLLPGERNIKVLQLVIDDINVQVGFRLLRFSLLEEDPPITIFFNEPISRENLNSPGSTSHTLEEEIRAQVFIRSDVPSDDSLLFIVLRHELLHCIGLGHDIFSNSVMYPHTARDSTSARNQWNYITDHDRRLLREAYNN